jgi:hypothetical protein
MNLWRLQFEEGKDQSDSFQHQRRPFTRSEDISDLQNQNRNVDGRGYDEEDIIFERETRERRRSRSRSRERTTVDSRRSTTDLEIVRSSRRRSLSAPRRRSAWDSEDDVQAEADFYNRKVAERAYIGEAYNGATKDWAIVDVPPGTRRVRMDGVGGSAQEITWQRYNGVRRSKFITDEEVYEGEFGAGQVQAPSKVRKKDMWTEITKDLVVKEAIESAGYDYEETEYFYYVMEYLRYVRFPFLFLSSLFFLVFGFFGFFCGSTCKLKAFILTCILRRMSCGSSRSPKTSAVTAATTCANCSGNATSLSAATAIATSMSASSSTTGAAGIGERTFHDRSSRLALRHSSIGGCMVSGKLAFAHLQLVGTAFLRWWHYPPFCLVFLLASLLSR